MLIKIRLLSFDQRMKLDEFSKKYQKKVSTQLKLNAGEPKFQAGEVVYLKPVPSKTPSSEFPSVGSDYEIDCKVISCKFSEQSNNLVYYLISGHGVQIRAIQDHLVAAKEKHLYYPNGFFEAIQTTELFPSGTIFTRIGEYYSNDLLGVYIHESRMDKIKNLFK